MKASVLFASLVFGAAALLAAPALRAGDTIRVGVVVDVTAAGKKTVPPTPDKPAFYIPLVIGYREMGDVLTYWQRPPPADAAVKQALIAALAAQGYRVAPPGEPAALVLTFRWGYINPAMRPYVNAKDDAIDKIEIANENALLTFIAGDHWREIYPNYDPDSRELISNLKDANGSRYFLLISALDAPAYANHRQVLLWRAHVTTQYWGHYLDQVLGTLITTAAPMLGRETVRPRIITAAAAPPEPVTRAFIGVAAGLLVGFSAMPAFAAIEPEETPFMVNPAAFPKPDPAHVCAELKVLSPEGAIWRRPVEDWEGARRRVAEDPEWKAWLATERSALDQWMAERRDRVAWVAGWGHEFVSPKDGSFLTWTPAVPGEDVAFLSSPSDPRVAITPVLFRAWVLDFRGAHAGKIHEAARMARLTGDRRYADWAAGQLDFYAANLQRWPVRSIIYGPSRLTEQPLDEATILIQLNEAARLIFDQVTPARRQMWFDRFFRPEAELLQQSMLRIHNIATWERSATAQVALLYGDEALWRFAVDGPWGLRQQMARGATSDYLWFEQSIAYDEYVSQAFLSFFTAAALAGRGPQFTTEMADLENLFLVPDLLRFPDGVLPNPSDNSRPRYAPLADTQLLAYRLLPNFPGLAVARQSRTWETLIDPPQNAPAAPVSLPEVTTRNFQSTRFAVLRAGGWQVFFHYGQLAETHTQAEALNFSAWYGDTEVTHDAGTVGYGSPLHRGYYNRGLDQNVPLIDGEGELPPHHGQLLEFDPAQPLVSAAQPHYRDDASAQRTLRIAGSSLFDRATLTAVDGNSHLLGLALHFQGRAVLPPVFAPADLATGRPEPFRYWRDVTAADFHDRAVFDVAYASGLVLRVTLATPGEFRLYHGSTPDTPPPARRESFYLEKRGRESVFTTEFTPLPARP